MAVEYTERPTVYSALSPSCREPVTVAGPAEDSDAADARPESATLKAVIADAVTGPVLSDAAVTPAELVKPAEVSTPLARRLVTVTSAAVSEPVLTLAAEMDPAAERPATAAKPDTVRPEEPSAAPAELSMPVAVMCATVAAPAEDSDAAVTPALVDKPEAPRRHPCSDR